MSDKEFKQIIAGMVVIVDTREKKNQHILDYFEKYNIPYEIRKLETADYTVEFPKNPEFNHCVLIERKGSLNELAGNFTTNRERFVREFERLENEEMHMIVEGASFKKILNQSYRSSMHPKAFIASLFTFYYRYNCNLWLLPSKEETPIVMYGLFYYHLREKILGNI